MRRDLLATRAKKVDDELKIVIVRDMWLTGFDAPSMHTMYLDKPMKGHGLMQAIARVNRVFKDKEGGLIVDYIGIAQNLKNALNDYSDGDRGKTGIDQAEAIAVMLEKYEIVKDMFFGFDYLSGLKGEGSTNRNGWCDRMDFRVTTQSCRERNINKSKKSCTQTLFRCSLKSQQSIFSCICQ